MACLTYKPSKVPYMGDQLTRDTMLLVLDKVLVRMKHNIKETDDLIQDINQSMMKYLSQVGTGSLVNANQSEDSEVQNAGGTSENERKYVRGFKSDLS